MLSSVHRHIISVSLIIGFGKGEYSLHFTGEITEIHRVSRLLDVTQLIPDSPLPALVSLDLLITPAVKSSFHDCVDPACLSFLCSWSIPFRV